MNEIHRLVLKPRVGKDDVELVAWDRDWNIHEVDIQDAGAVIDVWRTDDEAAEIRLVDDRPIGLRYLVLRGTDLDQLEEQIRSDLAIWTYTEAIAELSAAVDTREKISSALVVALTAPAEQDETAVKLLSRLAEDSDPAVRRAFVELTGYRQWPGLVSLLKDLRLRDPESSVRKSAEILLEGIARHGG